MKMSYKRVLLIVAPTFSWDNYNHPNETEYYEVRNGKKKLRIFSSIPIGVLSIAAYLKENSEDVDIQIIDFNLIINELENDNKMDKYNDFRELYRDVLSQYINFKPCFIGISAIFNSSYEGIKEIAYQCKQLFQEAIVIAGGGMATNAYDYLLNTIPELDFTCVGEGEIPFCNLVNADDIYTAAKNNPALVNRVKILEQSPIAHQFVTNLDEIPIHKAYDLINFYAYSDIHHAYGNIFTKKQDTSIILSLCSTRGCPHLCSFCCSHSIHGRVIRYYSADAIIAEIELGIDKFNINTLTFVDDNFLMDKKRAKKILTYLGQKNLNVTFPNGFTIYSIDKDIASLLKKAGVKEAALALESGNQDTLDKLIRKPLKLSMVAPAIECLQNEGLYVRGFFMLGFPGETKEAMQKSIDFLSSLNFNWTMCYVVTPFFGSEIFEICRTKGYIDNNIINEQGLFKGNLITTENFTAGYVAKLAYITNLKVNFINNYDMKNKNYKLALSRFEKILSYARDHAIAYYCAAICCENLGYDDKKSKYKQKYLEIIVKNSEWKLYATELGLENDKLAKKKIDI